MLTHYSRLGSARYFVNLLRGVCWKDGRNTVLNTLHTWREQCFDAWKGLVWRGK